MRGFYLLFFFLKGGAIAELPFLAFTVFSGSLSESSEGNSHVGFGDHVIALTTFLVSCATFLLLGLLLTTQPESTSEH